MSQGPCWLRAEAGDGPGGDAVCCLRCRRLFGLSRRICLRSWFRAGFRGSGRSDLGWRRCRFNRRRRRRVDLRLNVEAPHKPTNATKDDKVNDNSDGCIHKTRSSFYRSRPRRIRIRASSYNRADSRTEHSPGEGQSGSSVFLISVACLTRARKRLGLEHPRQAIALRVIRYLRKSRDRPGRHQVHNCHFPKQSFECAGGAFPPSLI